MRFFILHKIIKFSLWTIILLNLIGVYLQIIFIRPIDYYKVFEASLENVICILLLFWLDSKI